MAYAYKLLNAATEEAKLRAEEVARVEREYKVTLLHELEADLTGNAALKQAALEKRARLPTLGLKLTQEEIDSVVNAVTLNYEREHYKAIREADTSRASTLEDVLTTIETVKTTVQA